jgi:hypothetical protein
MVTKSIAAPIALTCEVRYGDAEASYYVTERAEIVQRGSSHLVLMYADGVLQGLHNLAGAFVGGDQSECSPVTRMTTRVKSIVADWTSDGWTLEVSRG